MPGFDQTGPLGYGPLSGRRGGRCGGRVVSRRAFYGAEPVRYGSRFGGFGRGYRWQYLETGLPRWARSLEPCTPSRNEDKVALLTELEREAKALEERLNDVKDYIESLKPEKSYESEEASSDTSERSQ
jgi:hypothetical protein